MKKYIFLVLFVILFSFSFTVQAKSLNRFYAEADESIYLSDDVDGSVFLAGSSIESVSNVDGVNIIAGRCLPLFITNLFQPHLSQLMM